MDPRLPDPVASSLLFYSNIAKAIKDVTEKYNAAQTTSPISAECLAISGALMDIQLLLTQPYAISSRIVSQTQLAEALNNAQKCCQFTISRLQEEVEKYVRRQASAGSIHSRSQTQPCDEVLVKGFLQRTQRHLTDVSMLIGAVQRNSAAEAQQLLQSDTFTGNTFEECEPRPITGFRNMSVNGGSSWKRFDADTKSIYTQSSSSASIYNYGTSKSDTYSEIDYDAASMMSASQFAPSISDKSKKPPRAQMGSIFFKMFKSNTELHRAAKKGDVKKIKSLLEIGVDVNYEGSSGCTALHIATDHGHEKAVKVLLDNGANPSTKSSEGRTPMHSAARTGHTAVVQLLMEYGVEVQTKDPSGSTPLHIAAYNGQESVVQILLKSHHNIEARGPSGFTALHVAAFNGQSAVVRQLVEMGANIEARSDTGRTALQLAAEKGHEAVVRHLLQHGANVMTMDNMGRTALQGAVSNQHGVVAQLLLENVAVPGTASHQLPQRGPPGFPDSNAPASPTWTRQASMQSQFELPAAPVVVAELPAYDIKISPGKRR